MSWGGASGPCCAPPAANRTARPAALAFDVPSRDPREVARRMVAIPGGNFRMGGADPDQVVGDGEGPVRTVFLRPYAMDATAVTNAQFATFVKATAYVTDAERAGWSPVFHLHIGPAARTAVMEAVLPDAPWWRAVRDASWRHPHGPGSDAARRQNHPVVHVSWNDAVAYAAWAGKRLPTEAEWEMAARGGLHQARFPWGDELVARGRHHCNIWQGAFPDLDTAEDGYAGTAPVKAYPANGYGLYGTAGNVWEWCADRWSRTWHVEDRKETRVDPQGPPSGDGRVIRGGSYLCHESYCNRYRVAARSSATPETSTGNMGFRCALSAPG